MGKIYFVFRRYANHLTGNDLRCQWQARPDRKLENFTRVSVGLPDPGRSSLGNAAASRKTAEVWCCDKRLSNCLRLCAASSAALYPQCKTYVAPT